MRRILRSARSAFSWRSLLPAPMTDKSSPALSASAIDLLVQRAARAEVQQANDASSRLKARQAHARRANSIETSTRRHADDRSGVAAGSDRRSGAGPPICNWRSIGRSAPSDPDGPIDWPAAELTAARRVFAFSAWRSLPEISATGRPARCLRRHRPRRCSHDAREGRDEVALVEARRIQNAIYRQS